MRMARDRVTARQRRGVSPRSALSRDGARSVISADEVEAEIASLDALSIKDLRFAWQRLHDAKPPTRMSRDI